MVSEARDKIAILLAAIVGVFILGSLTLIITLAFTGAGPGVGENVWAGLFSLVTAILGALGGYLGGVAVTTKRQTSSNGETQP